MPALDPSGDPVDLGSNITLSTPGLEGEALTVGIAFGVRSLRVDTPVLDTALAEQDVSVLHTIEIQGAIEVGSTVAHNTRSERFSEPTMLLEVPAVRADYVQVVLMQDEAGLLTWNFAEAPATLLSATRRRGSAAFVLRRYVPKSPPTSGQRGLIGVAGTKVIKLLAFPIRKAGGASADSIAEPWESKYRPYSIRSVDPSSYGTVDGGVDLDPSWWKTPRGPILMLMHGTFSRSSDTFGGLPADVFKRLYEAYNGLVVAFDHPTMTVTPEDNIQVLLSRIATDATVTVDVLSHSRGGLVGRTLAEKLGQFSSKSQVNVRRLVLVGAPDNGTALANADNMSDFLDSFTNLINFFPDTSSVVAFQCIVAAVKELAAGGLQHLVGLQSMMPSGEFQKWLNVGPKSTSEYFAVAASFAPTQSGLKEWVAQRLAGAIFSQAMNDLVVPMEGVYGTNGSDCFPIAAESSLKFDQGEGVNHFGYFSQSELHQKLFEWLPG